MAQDTKQPDSIHKQGYSSTREQRTLKTFTSYEKRRGVYCAAYGYQIYNYQKAPPQSNRKPQNKAFAFLKDCKRARIILQVTLIQHAN